MERLRPFCFLGDCFIWKLTRLQSFVRFRSLRGCGKARKVFYNHHDIDMDTTSQKSVNMCTQNELSICTYFKS